METLPISRWHLCCWRQAFERLRYATEEAVTLAPIPCWAHLSPELYRTRIAGLVQSIETAAAEERKRTGCPVMGVEGFERDPQHRPAKLSRSPAPLVHAVTERARKEFYGMYSWFAGRLPGCGQNAAPRRPHGLLPGRQLSSGTALRLGIATAI